MASTIHQRMRPRRTKTACLALVVGAALGLAGCTGSSGGDEPSTKASTAAPAPHTTASQTKTTAVDAGNAALDASPGATVISVERESAGTQWEVEAVHDGTVQIIRVSASDASVTSGPTTKNEDSQDIAEHTSQVKKAKIDFARAAAIIRKQVANGTITELNLDDRRGSVVWEADVIDTSGTKHEIAVDAVDGTVVANGTESSGG